MEVLSLNRVGQKTQQCGEVLSQKKPEPSTAILNDQICRERIHNIKNIKSAPLKNITHSVARCICLIYLSFTQIKEQPDEAP